MIGKGNHLCIIFSRVKNYYGVGAFSAIYLAKSIKVSNSDFDNDDYVAIKIPNPDFDSTVLRWESEVLKTLASNETIQSSNLPVPRLAIRRFILRLTLFIICLF